jgi:hypothetical protein
MTTKTTYRSLNDRASRFVASLPASDPLVRANAMIDRAVAAQDAGDFALAETLLDLADTLTA